jgi:hypothetical protein
MVHNCLIRQYQGSFLLFVLLLGLFPESITVQFRFKFSDISPKMVLVMNPTLSNSATSQSPFTKMNSHFQKKEVY